MIMIEDNWENKSTQTEPEEQSANVTKYIIPKITPNIKIASTSKNTPTVGKNDRKKLDKPATRKRKISDTWECYVCHKLLIADSLNKRARHFKTHTYRPINDFPDHRCPSCPSRFNDSQSVLTHYQKAHSNWKCKNCDRKYNTQANLMAHMIMKHNATYST